MRAEARVNGHFLSLMCHWGDLKWTTRWPYGDFEARCNILMPRGWRHPALVEGAVFEVMYGANRLLLADLATFDPETGELSAKGRIRQGAGFYALTDTGASTAVPDTAIDVANGTTAPSGALAIARDLLKWTRTSTFYSTAVASTTPAEAIKIWPDLLDAITARGGGTPYMYPDGVIRLLTAPTTPTWHTRPLSTDMGVDDDTYRSFFLLDYLNSSAGNARTRTYAVDATANAAKPVEEFVDVTGLGPMTPANAATIADTLLAQALMPSWTTDIVADASSVTNYGGQPINPLLLRAGELGRVWGVAHPRIPTPFIDVLAGDVEVDASARTALIKPWRKAPSTPEEITELVLNRGSAATRWSVAA